jgi:hypothetical protein
MRRIAVVVGWIFLAASGWLPEPKTPLTRAAVAGPEEVRRLIEAGADVNEGAGTGWTPLIWAARSGQVGSLEALVAAGARVEQRDGRGSGWTPLVHAIHKHQVRAARALLEAGADPNARQAGGATPLMFAAAYGDVEIVRDLLDHGADPRARGVGGVDALGNAVGGGALFDFTDGPRLGTCHPAVVRVLLARAPDLELRPGPGLKVARWLGGSRGCPEALALLGARAPR